ncbi:hypothetical protein WMF04_18140 [Sorangium sp. So ce260]|uniref:hypothetical protein n=1 Tax=Sorangium sp. So ce260 TaxID=3133291 RepID=UPI003F61C6DF
MSAWKEPVRICIPTNINATTSQVQNGVTLALNDRVLLMAQSHAPQNGIYYVQSVSAPNVTLARASDAAASTDFTPGMSVCVGPEGTRYANTEWVLTATGPVTLGTTSLTFKQRVFGPASAPTVHASEQAGADAGEKIRNAIIALPCTGGVVDARGITGDVDVTAPIVVDRPVTLLIGAATYTAKESDATPPTVANPMFDIQPTNTHCGSSRPNFAVIGLDPYASTFKTTIEDGAIFEMSGDFTGPIGRGRAVFSVEQMALDGGNTGGAGVTGSMMLKAHSLPTLDFQDGLIRIEHNTIQNFGGTAIHIGDSVYVYRIHGNQFKLNASSVHIGLYADGSIKENWFFQAPYSAGSGPTLTLLGPAVRVVNNYFMRAQIGDAVAEPDILLVPSGGRPNRQAGGYTWILDNRFAVERENFNKARVRIRVRGQTGGAEDLTTVGGPLMIRGNFFLGNAGEILSVSAESNVVTVTLKSEGVSNEPTKGLAVGDRVTITGVTPPDFNGVFTVTAVTQTTFQYALTTDESSGTGGVVSSAETFAIELNNPGFMHDIRQNIFASYATLIKDTQSRVEGSYGGSTLADNYVIPPRGGGYREFVNEGREFSVVQPSAGSALEPVNGEARQVETTYLINRLQKSELLAEWNKNGGIVVTSGEADPFGTARAFKVTLGGSTHSQYISSFIDITSPSSALPTGTRLFITFWARTPPGSDTSTMQVSLRDNTDQKTAGDLFTVNLGPRWKKYKLVSNGITSGHVYRLLFYPGYSDRIHGEVALFGPQVSELDADYLPNAGTASAYDKTAGSRFEQAAIFTAIKTSLRARTSAPTVVAVSDPSGLGADGSVALVAGSTQVAGTIELTTDSDGGTSSSGSVEVVFVGSDYATGNAPVVIATLADGNHAWAATGQARISASSRESFTVAWSTNAAALAAGGTYRINYHVLA